MEHLKTASVIAPLGWERESDFLYGFRFLSYAYRALVRLVAAQANCALSHEFADISLELPAQAEALIETDPVFKHLEETI